MTQWRAQFQVVVKFGQPLGFLWSTFDFERRELLCAVNHHWTREQVFWLVLINWLGSFPSRCSRFVSKNFWVSNKQDQGFRLTAEVHRHTIKKGCVAIKRYIDWSQVLHELCTGWNTESWACSLYRTQKFLKWPPVVWICFSTGGNLAVVWVEDDIHKMYYFIIGYIIRHQSPNR